MYKILVWIHLFGLFQTYGMYTIIELDNRWFDTCIWTFEYDIYYKKGSNIFGMFIY